VRRGSALKIEQENGFTIVELLAAMVVSSLVIGFVLSMYLFSERIMARYEKESDVKVLVSGCLQRIIMDIESSEKTIRCDDTSLVLQQSPLKEIKYHFDVSRVWRNGVSMSQIPFAGDDPRIELSSRVSFDEDTVSLRPKRYWNIHVIGREGNIADSDNTSISTIITSQELVSRAVNQATR
jgi:prepilin-type N-terminal cleavage/methylation domain-containing protein